MSVCGSSRLIDISPICPTPPIETMSESGIETVTVTVAMTGTEGIEIDLETGIGIETIKPSIEETVEKVGKNTVRTIEQYLLLQ